MTNEQLAAFLEWIEDSLDRELYDLKQYLNTLDGVERRPNLYRDGEYRGRAADYASVLYSDEELEEWAAREGYEVRYDGEPVKMNKLYSILSRLRQHRRLLTNKGH